MLVNFLHTQSRMIQRYETINPKRIFIPGVVCFFCKRENTVERFSGIKRFHKIFICDDKPYIIFSEFIFFASSAVCVKLASNNVFEIVVRQIENPETHLLKISVSIRL